MARRFSVAGTSGSGKTTVARALAARLGVPHIELDALFHGPGWTPAARDVFAERVLEAMASAPDGWVADGNYDGQLGDLILERADTLVWLDMPLRVCLRRLWRRTWRRIARGEELWNGNRENVRTAFFTRDSLFVWAVRTHGRRRRELPERIARNPHLAVVRLRAPREVAGWLATVSPPR